MAKYSMDKLKDKYEGFIAPTIKIYINNNEITEKDINIRSLEVELTAGYEASGSVFEIVDLFDISSRTFSKEAMDKYFQLGYSVEIKIGYIKTMTVFKGYIFSIEARFDGIDLPYLSIECTDVKSIMMNSLRSELKKGMKKYSEAVKEVLKPYKKLVDKQTIESTAEVKGVIEQHQQSDYEFIVNIAKRLNFEFYIINGQLYFGIIAKDTTSLIELEFGSDILAFNREISLANQLSEVTVKSNNEFDPQKPIEVTVNRFKKIGKGKKGSKEITKLLTKNIKKTIIDPSIRTDKEAKALAEAELTRASLKFATGNVEMIGLPEIIPGKFITLSGLGDGFNNDYYVLKVIHTVNEGRFTTQCEIGVNKI